MTVLKAAKYPTRAPASDDDPSSRERTRKDAAKTVEHHDHPVMGHPHIEHADASHYHHLPVTITISDLEYITDDNGDAYSRMKIEFPSYCGCDRIYLTTSAPYRTRQLGGTANTQLHLTYERHKTNSQPYQLHEHGEYNASEKTSKVTLDVAHGVSVSAQVYTEASSKEYPISEVYILPHAKIPTTED